MAKTINEIRTASTGKSVGSTPDKSVQQIYRHAFEKHYLLKQHGKALAKLESRKPV